MNTKTVYAVVSKTGKTALTFVGWVGFSMNSFNEKELYNQAYEILKGGSFEVQKDNHDNIQIFETPESAQATVDELRKEGKVQLGNLRLIEIELTINSKLLHAL